MKYYEHPRKMGYIRSALAVYVSVLRHSRSPENRSFILGMYTGMCGVLGVDGYDYEETRNQLKRIMGVVE